MKAEIVALLMKAGYRELVDKTMHRRGSLWAITDRAASIDAVYFVWLNMRYETNSIYAPHGGRSTGYRAAWFWVPGHEPGVWLRPGILEDGLYAGA
jgi:hypothetical protein